MNCFMYAEWMTTISEGTLERIVWIFTPGNAGVIGNKRANVAITDRRANPMRGAGCEYET